MIVIPVKWLRHPPLCQKNRWTDIPFCVGSSRPTLVIVNPVGNSQTSENILLLLPLITRTRLFLFETIAILSPTVCVYSGRSETHLSILKVNGGIFPLRFVCKAIRREIETAFLLFAIEQRWVVSLFFCDVVVVIYFRKRIAYFESTTTNGKVFLFFFIDLVNLDFIIQGLSLPWPWSAVSYTNSFLVRDFDIRPPTVDITGKYFTQVPRHSNYENETLPEGIA